MFRYIMMYLMIGWLCAFAIVLTKDDAKEKYWRDNNSIAERMLGIAGVIIVWPTVPFIWASKENESRS